MGRPGLNRRQLLGGLGGLSVAGGFGFAALGTGADALASGANTRVRYWNLFSGGDGSNMIAMLDAFREDNPDIAVKDSTLQWGSPFYTKLAMAAAGNRAPDLGVMHLGRVTGFSPGRFLDPWDVGLLAGGDESGVPGDPAAGLGDHVPPGRPRPARVGQFGPEHASRPGVLGKQVPFLSLIHI